jgi:hypothetical protein
MKREDQGRAQFEAIIALRLAVYCFLRGRLSGIKLPKAVRSFRLSASPGVGDQLRFASNAIASFSCPVADLAHD